MSIIVIDMHLRDERVFDFLKANAKHGYLKVSHETIAKQMKCHRHTAAAILSRLIGAGLVEIADHSARRGGLTYRVRE